MLEPKEDELTQKPTGEGIAGEVVGILEEMTSDWDLDFAGGITEGTRLVEDLGFESIDVVQLVAAIEERFGRRGLPFHELLMKDENYVDEIEVAQIVRFLEKHIS